MLDILKLPCQGIFQETPGTCASEQRIFATDLRAGEGARNL